MYSSSREKSITVEYQDVVPTTDLPPSVNGKPNCYLHIVVGKLTWKSCDCNDYKLPLPTSMYIRLRWWGDSSQGTFFRPQIEKCTRVIKCRAQFCVRSLPRQIAAYFKDMGSATFDILPSPNSLPIGRVLVSAIVSLSCKTSIRGSFPIRTPSAKNIGELQVAMSFKPRRCNCEEINLEALGTCKQLCFRSCPPRIRCFVKKQKELREGRVSSSNTSNAKGSACYVKLSATGKYGRRACVCDDENECREMLVDPAEGTSSTELSDTCIAQNKCKLLDQCEEYTRHRETSPAADYCQAQVLSGLIQETKKLNNELVTALCSRTLKEECKRKRDDSRGVARVSILALELQTPSNRCTCCLDPCCPRSSHTCAMKDARLIYMVEYKFPPHLACPLTCQSPTTCVRSNNIWPGGRVRFDESTTFAIICTPSSLQDWISESLCFVVMRKDINCAEASVVGRATLALRCVIDSPMLAYSGAIPVTSIPQQYGCQARTVGTLQVSVELTCEGKAFTPSTSSCSTPPSPPPCFFKNTPDKECWKSMKRCRYKKTETLDKSTETQDLVTKPSDEMKPSEQHEDIAPQLFTPSCLFMYLFVDEAKNIPAVRLQEGGCCKCFPPNVYLVVRGCFPTGNDDFSTSSTVWDCHNPSFRFADLFPVKVSDNLLETFQHKSIIVEVWTKMSAPCQSSDKLLGLARLPLTHFYEALKDNDVTKMLSDLGPPLIALDGFQPICDVFSHEKRGQLKVLLALGTQQQINELRKRLEFPETDESIGSEPKSTDESSCSDEPDQVEHVLKLTIHGLQGFVPCAKQVSDKTCCFIEYFFPTQKRCDDDKSRSISMKSHRTSNTACVRNLRLSYKSTHKFLLPPGVSLEEGIRSNDEDCCEDGLSFKLWASRCSPKPRSQLLAKKATEVLCIGRIQTRLGDLIHRRNNVAWSLGESRTKILRSTGPFVPRMTINEAKLVHMREANKGCLSLSKLYELLSRATGKEDHEKYQIPMKFSKPCNKLAGDLFLTIKYISPAPAAAPPEDHPYVAKHYDDVHIRFTLQQACGLKAAARLLTGSAGEDGITSYAIINTSFLPTPKTYTTRDVERSYSPDYNHCVELHSPVVLGEDGGKPLVALLDAGYIEIKLWQKCSSNNSNSTRDDVLLGKAKVPTRHVLYKANGHECWFPLLNTCRKSQALEKVGYVKVSISFASDDALRLVFEGALDAGWSPPPGSDLQSLLDFSSGKQIKPLDKFDTDEDYVTFRLNVTNVWLSQKLAVSSSGKSDKEMRKDSCVYLRYKFHDRDSILSSFRRVFGKEKKKDKNVINVKFGHQRAFLCKPDPCLLWYLREGTFEIQVWFSGTRAHKAMKRPSDSDILLGSVYIDISPLLIGRLRAPQHICEIYSLFKPGSDDIDDASVQICLRLSPGNDVKLYENDESDGDETLVTLEKEDKGKKLDDSDYFSAVVAVERAVYLVHRPPVITFKKDDGLDVRFYVTFPVENNVREEKTKFADASASPVWNDAREVLLDREIFHKKGGKIMFRIWQKDGVTPKSTTSSDHVIGFATVDLSVLLNGFRAVTGWYNVIDVFGNCQGEIKIGVTPTNPMQLPKADQPPFPWSSYRSILHSAPLLCPVVSHLGSVYFPGVSSGADTVAGSFFNENANRSHQTNSAGLHQNLLQQIKQLDQLKNNLQQKNIFTQSKAPTFYPSPSAPPITSKPSDVAKLIKSTSSDMPVSRSSEHSGTNTNGTSTSSVNLNQIPTPSGSCKEKNQFYENTELARTACPETLSRNAFISNPVNLKIVESNRFLLVENNRIIRHTLTINTVETHRARIRSVSDFSAPKSCGDRGSEQSMRKSLVGKVKPSSGESKQAKKSSKPSNKREKSSSIQRKSLNLNRRRAY